MSKEDQDEYACVSIEVGNILVEVEGNHTLDEVEESAKSQLEEAKQLAKSMGKAGSGACYE